MRNKEEKSKDLIVKIKLSKRRFKKDEGGCRDFIREQ